MKNSVSLKVEEVVSLLKQYNFSNVIVFSHKSVISITAFRPCLTSIFLRDLLRYVDDFVFTDNQIRIYL